jgi:hypothetical protein
MQVRRFFIEELAYGNKGDTELIIGTLRGWGLGVGDWGLGKKGLGIQSRFLTGNSTQ